VNAVMNLRFHKMLGSSWVAAQLAASLEGLSSMSEWAIYCVKLLAGRRKQRSLPLRIWSPSSALPCRQTVLNHSSDQNVLKGVKKPGSESAEAMSVWC
jgi:hypothetical protein